MNQANKCSLQNSMKHKSLKSVSKLIKYSIYMPLYSCTTKGGWCGGKDRKNKKLVVACMWKTRTTSSRHHGFRNCMVVNSLSFIENADILHSKTNKNSTSQFLKTYCTETHCGSSGIAMAFHCWARGCWFNLGRSGRISMAECKNPRVPCIGCVLKSPK